MNTFTHGKCELSWESVREESYVRLAELKRLLASSLLRAQ